MPKSVRMASSIWMLYGVIPVSATDTPGQCRLPDRGHDERLNILGSVGGYSLVDEDIRQCGVPVRNELACISGGSRSMIA